MKANSLHNINHIQSNECKRPYQLGDGSVLVDIDCGGSVFGPWFVIQYVVSV